MMRCVGVRLFPLPWFVESFLWGRERNDVGLAGSPGISTSGRRCVGGLRGAGAEVEHVETEETGVRICTMYVIVVESV